MKKQASESVMDDITNISSAINAKYSQIALWSVLVHKPLNLGYICIWTPGQMVTDAI